MLFTSTARPNACIQWIWYNSLFEKKVKPRLMVVTLVDGEKFCENKVSKGMY